jgi:hypothetical protein
MGESRAARDRAAAGSLIANPREDAGTAAPPCASLSLARLPRAELPIKCRGIAASLPLGPLGASNERRSLPGFENSFDAVE